MCCCSMFPGLHASDPALNPILHAISLGADPQKQKHALLLLKRLAQVCVNAVGFTPPVTAGKTAGNCLFKSRVEDGVVVHSTPVQVLLGLMGAYTNAGSATASVTDRSKSAATTTTERVSLLFLNDILLPTTSLPPAQLQVHMHLAHQILAAGLFERVRACFVPGKEHESSGRKSASSSSGSRKLWMGSRLPASHGEANSAQEKALFTGPLVLALALALRTSTPGKLMHTLYRI